MQNAPQPPNNLSAELCLLAALIIDEKPTTYQYCKSISLEPKCFYHPKNQTIYSAIQSLWDTGTAPDLVTLNDRLTRTGELAKIGGVMTLSEITANIETTNQAAKHADIVRNTYLLREIVKKAREIESDAAKHTDDVAEFAKDLSVKLDAISKEAKGHDPIPGLVIDDLAELIAHPPTPEDVIIDGVARRKALVKMDAPSKTGKSFIAADLAICLATGGKWMGFDCRKQCKVAYLNFELTRYDFQYRIKQLCEARGIDFRLAAKYITPFCFKETSTERLFIVNLFEPLMKILDGKYDVVILDPLYSIYGDYDENSNSNMAIVMSKLSEIAYKANAMLFFVHHHPKGDVSERASIDHGAGASTIGRKVDASISLAKSDTPEVFEVNCVVRSFKPIDKFYVTYGMDTRLFTRCEKPETPGKRGKYDFIKSVYDLTYEQLTSVFMENFLCDKETAEDEIRKCLLRSKPPLMRNPKNDRWFAA